VTSERIVSWILAGVSTLVEVGLWIAVIVIAIVKWREVKPLLLRGLAYAGIRLALGLPMTVLVLTHMDWTKISPQMTPQLVDAMAGIMVLAQLGTLAVQLAHGTFELPSAVACDPTGTPFPLFTSRPGRVRGLGVGAATGAGAAVLSLALFMLVKVDAGQELKAIVKMLPGIDWRSPAVMLGASLPLVLSAALAEEVTYRGILQPLIAGPRNGSRVRPIIAIVVTSLLWAFGHSLNTNAPFLKLGQVFLIGLAFGAIARKWSVEASAAAHLVLNLVATLGAWAL
jgi:membrane protease YdiL (CAAX protease family)